MTTEGARSTRLTAVMREGERVKPLELFFDLVFVLAITQCTALMVEQASWEGLGEGVLILALLWWAWVGYSWLTSVVDPEEGAVRIALFAAMAAVLLVSLSLPEAFGGRALEFALAYCAVRAGHILLFVLASREDRALRHAVSGLAVGTGAGCALLVVGSFLDPGWQAALWMLALALDMGEPYVYPAGAWRLAPGHFAERHGLIMIVALGESIVALGVGAEVAFGIGVAAAAVLGIALVCELWWIYFDIVGSGTRWREMSTPTSTSRSWWAS
jgi:low temperature requirement protein LtrA